MNRRKAIGGLLVGLGGIAGITGYKWYEWNKVPDLAYVDQSKTLLTALAETIIPSTDSPGAGTADVAGYIILMIRDCTERKSQNHFIDGLKELVDFTKVHYNKPYEACSPAEQTRIMRNFQEAGKPMKGLLGKAQARYTGNSFFTTLRLYTIQGYCSSKAGATTALAYVPVPGAYHGNIKIGTAQKSWATK